MPGDTEELFPQEIRDPRGNLLQEEETPEYFEIKQQAKQMACDFLKNHNQPITEEAITSLLPGFVRQIKISRNLPQK